MEAGQGGRIMSDSKIYQGSTYLHQVICKETPFFVTVNYDIAYRDISNVVLVTGRSGKAAKESMHEICHALNMAYKYGYEMNIELSGDK